MSEPIPFPGHTIQPADSLQVPDDPSALKQRVLDLTGQDRPLFVERAELRAACRLLLEGSITAADVWAALRDLYYIGANVGIDYQVQKDAEDWLRPLHRDLVVIWGRLQQLIQGYPVALPEMPRPPAADEEYDSTYQQAYEEWWDANRGRSQKWFAELMVEVERHLDNDNATGLYSFDAAGQLPRELRAYIEHEFAWDWHASPLTLGASLEALPVPGGTCFGQNDNGVELLDALAQAVRWAIQAYDAASKDAEKRAVIAGQLSLYWMFLKGFVYSLNRARSGRLLAVDLVGHPEVVERAVLSLGDGLKRIELAGDNITPRWVGHHRGLDDQIAAIPTQVVIDRLYERIAAERREIEAWRNLP